MTATVTPGATALRAAYRMASTDWLACAAAGAGERAARAVRACGDDVPPRSPSQPPPDTCSTSTTPALVGAGSLHGPLGVSAVLGGGWPAVGEGHGEGRGPAITRTWVKLHPSCLGKHSPIPGRGPSTCSSPRACGKRPLAARRSPLAARRERGRR